MPLQQEILSQVLQERSQIFEVLRATFRTEAKVDDLSRRMDSFEQRERAQHDQSSITHQGHLENRRRIEALERERLQMITERRKRPRQEWTPRDYLIATAGAGLVMAAVLDKIPWSAVQSFVSNLK